MDGREFQELVCNQLEDKKAELARLMRLTFPWDYGLKGPKYKPGERTGYYHATRLLAREVREEQREVATECAPWFSASVFGSLHLREAA